MAVKDEWQTPQEVLGHARRAMGGSMIDLDPASSAEANARVLAMLFHTKESDGLSPAQSWECRRLFLNPPFSKPKPWFLRLADAWRTGTVDMGVAILSDRGMSTEAGATLLEAARVVCIPTARVAFVPPAGEAASSPSFGVILVAGGRKLSAVNALESFSTLGTAWLRV